MMAKKEGIFAGVALAVSCHNRGRADTSSYSDAVATFAKECGCNIESAETNLGNGRNHALPEEKRAEKASAYKVCQDGSAQYCNAVMGN
ncbi:hypothetical protein [Sinorhizobium sp. GL28]|uniref:hypothetical protein n=1 Tax=Sinorhizobium sp. GL28 TaxID=1358418 RepID=UPI000723EDC9|nr:hypothetical protein [Sinorhizobium sp. GL28]KSV87446.1 hypothetical protein N184_30985 [Sinorhizobium sp. GL28]